jgi:hypothetical protein
MAVVNNLGSSFGKPLIVKTRAYGCGGRHVGLQLNHH